MAALAGGLLVALLAAGGWQAFTDGPPPNEPPPNESPADESPADEVTSPDQETTGPSTGDDVAPSAGDAGGDRRGRSNRCDPAAVAAALRGAGAAEADGEPPSSAYRLATESDAAVRGRLISATPGAGGTFLELEVDDAIGTERTVPGPVIIWTAGIDPPAGPFAAEIVASLTGDRVDGGAVVQPGGLWLGCDATTPAEPVVAAAVEPSWPTRPSLDDLWRIHLAAAAPAGSAIAPTVDGPVAIYDIRVDGGDRFRVTVPEAVATQLVPVDDTPGGPTSLIGDGLSIELTISPCTVRSVAADVHWALSARMVEDGRLVDGVVRLCRPDELLSMTVDTADLDRLVATERADWLDGFDVRPISVGPRYGSVLTAARPELAGCPACSSWGPLDYPDVGVVVGRTEPEVVSAVGRADLVERWSFASTAGELALRPTASAALLDVAGGPLLALEPATGSLRWQVARPPGELGEGVAEQQDGDALAWSSFTDPGDDRPPRLRWLDVETGSLRWESAGRDGADWQQDEPIVVGGVAIVMDVLAAEARAPDEPGSQLLAFDTADGRLLWTIDVGSPAGARSRHVLELLEAPSGPAVVARTTDGAVFRIDPISGDELWRIRLDADRIDGTARADDGTVGLLARTVFGPRLLDLATGRLLDR